MLSNIFNSIKNEELSFLDAEIRQGKAVALQNGQLNSSEDVYKNSNLAKDCVNKVYKRILQKLKDDKLNHFIKKNSSVFLEFTDALINEVYATMEAALTNTNSIEESGLLYRAYKKPLLQYKKEIIEQWNTESVIQSHIKKQERFRQIRNYLITFVIALVVTIIGLILNSGSKPVEKVIEKQVQVAPAIVIEKVKSSPEARQKASYIYNVFKNFDEIDFRELLKALYLKFSQ